MANDSLKNSTVNVFHTLKVLLPFLRGQEKGAFRFFIALIIVFLTMGCNLVIPLLMKKSVYFLESHFLDKAFFVILAYGIVWTLSQILGNIRELVLVRVLEKAVTNLSLTIFNHLHRLSLRFHLNRQTGAVIHAIEKAQGAVPDVFFGIFLYIIPTIIEIIVAGIILVHLYSAAYGLLLLGVFSLFFLLNFVSMGWAYKMQRRRNKVRSKSNSFIVDSLLNFETIKCFNTMAIESEQCGFLLQEREKAMIRFERLMNGIGIVQGCLIGIGLIFMTLMVGKDIQAGLLKTEDFILINGYFIQFAGPLSFFGQVLKSIRKGLTEIENAISILDEQPEIQDSPAATNLIIPNKQASITFEDVYFSYEEQRAILQGVSFTVPAGKTVAIVGATGSGKSTIARLLFRFYDVTKGKILINNQDIRLLRLSSLRENLGIVPQDTILFNNTLYYNIAYARLDCPVEEVKKAIEMCHLEPLLKASPEGYQTIVGERGLKLSGGEKQRIAIARLVLKSPPICVYDEATSALDTKTEGEIQQQLKELSAGKTTIIIAHRLSTIVHADTIIVLEEGKIIEQGSHRELLKQEGRYASLWNRQQAEKKII